jgi:hypothetical protein
MAAEPDKDIIGTWMQTKEGETYLMIIGRHANAPDVNNKMYLPRGLMTYERFTLGTDGRLSRGPSGVCFVSRIKSESYANIFDPDVVQEAQKRGEWGYSDNSIFFLLKYRVTKNTLSVSYPDIEKAKAAIANGALKGTVTKNMGSDQVEFAGGLDMARYLTREGSAGLYPTEPEEKWQRAKIVPVE